MKPIALLVSWWNPSTKEEGYDWETPQEKIISNHTTREEALANRPAGYIHLDVDGWTQI